MALCAASASANAQAPDDAASDRIAAVETSPARAYQIGDRPADRFSIVRLEEAPEH